MSNKPQPAATLTAILCERWFNDPRPRKGKPMPWIDGSRCAAEWAALASDLCRLAPAIERQGVAECNGEWFDGQRSKLYAYSDASNAGDREHGERCLSNLSASIATKRDQLDRRLTKLNARLAPFSLIASGYAGGGLYLGVSSTDASRPLDMIVGA